MEPVVKRKRGRPRKTVIEAPIGSVVKGKRGRPRKIVTEIPPMKEIKRKRGRPRKKMEKLSTEMTDYPWVNVRRFSEYDQLNRMQLKLHRERLEKLLLAKLRVPIIL